MSYRRHFLLVDDVAEHFDTSVGTAVGFLQSRYVGFYAVAAAAVLELALKDVIVAFAQHHHALFGEYITSRYERINGRIRIGHIASDHLKPFGKRFEDGFKKLLQERDERSIRENSFSVIHSYEALLVCRHQFWLF